MSQSLWHWSKGITLIMYLVCKSKPEKSSKVLHTFNTNLFFLLIALNGSKTDYDGSKLRPFCKFSCCDERSWLLSRERSLHYKLKRCLKMPVFHRTYISFTLHKAFITFSNITNKSIIFLYFHRRKILTIHHQFILSILSFYLFLYFF